MGARWARLETAKTTREKTWGDHFFLGGRLLVAWLGAIASLDQLLQDRLDPLHSVQKTALAGAAIGDFHGTLRMHALEAPQTVSDHLGIDAETLGDFGVGHFGVGGKVGRRRSRTRCGRLDRRRGGRGALDRRRGRGPGGWRLGMALAGDPQEVLFREDQTLPDSELSRSQCDPAGAERPAKVRAELLPQEDLASWDNLLNSLFMPFMPFMVDSIPDFSLELRPPCRTESGA
jgi:hypothetical protein